MSNLKEDKMFVRYSKAVYCPECDIIYSNKINCPVCGNKSGCSMNCIRNNAAKLAKDYSELVGEKRAVNFNQTSLF